MEASAVFGFVLLLLGAACGGSFGLPSKFVKKDTPWETLWGPFFFFVTILLPVTVFPLIAKGLFATAAEAGWGVIAMPVLFGFLWGLGSMTLGLSFTFIGLSLAYAINYGAQIACGGMGPFIIHHPDQLTTAHGAVIVAGVVVCILGVIVCGRAGVLKSKSQAGAGGSATAGGVTVVKGMTLAFLSGILCACYSIAFSYGGGVMEHSMKAHGNPGWAAAFVVSALILWGGAFSACGYCAYKLTKNKSWSSLTAPGIGRVLLIAFIMSLLHDGAILFFGVGASKLGALGVAVGYAAFMSFAIIVGNVNGFLTKEWKGASRQSVAWIGGGIAVLIVGVCLLAAGNFMQGEYAKKHAEQALR
jgi:L-rhamnose-H+ transport protein